MVTPGPNEPCRCGSGRRYKRCCAMQDRAAKRQRKTIGRVVIALLVVGGIGLALEWMRRSAPDDVDGYRYDAINDRYWHEEHGHWHDGPPPGYAGADLPAGSVPEPWQYDAASHRHWHPDHAHWHDGFPPEGQGPPIPRAGPVPEDVAPAVPVPRPAPVNDVDLGVSEQPLESDPG